MEMNSAVLYLFLLCFFVKVISICLAYPNTAKIKFLFSIKKGCSRSTVILIDKLILDFLKQVQPYSFISDLIAEVGRDAARQRLEPLYHFIWNFEGVSF